jgi:hypothetical protein
MYPSAGRAARSRRGLEVRVVELVGLDPNVALPYSAAISGGRKIVSPMSVR